ncbi:MAG: nucleotide sugar dehydrogenase [Gemmataceae bacterium]
MHAVAEDSSATGAALSLRNAIVHQQARIGIIGLGYVGLPLARAFVDREFSVLGFDVDSEKIDHLRRGASYMRHFPDANVAAMRAGGRFDATDQLERLGEMDVVIICVPTPLTPTREPDLSCVISVGRSIAQGLRRGQLIVLESTTYPGTTRDVLLPLLQESGLTAGVDFFLAFSPEREDPGNQTFTTATIPKVVGGLDPSSLDLAVALYGQIVRQVVPVSSPEVAEACKILENTYRAVNIALVNELKMLYDRMGINVWEVIEAAKTKPFGFQAFYPGPGLGGHCIPVDPFYLSWIARKFGMTTRFIELAGQINVAMPDFVIAKVGDALNERGKPIKGSKIALLGMAFKKDVDDIRESPGLALLDQLRRKGAEVSYNDPHVPRLPSRSLESQPLTPDYLQAQDGILIVTDHSAYDWPWIAEHAALIVDTRNATRAVAGHRDNIVRA